MLRTMRLGGCAISSVIEYTAPTHDPTTLFPGLDPARAAALGRAVGESHYVAAMRRMVVTVQTWVVRSGSDVILVDAGVGNGKTRALPRMDALNTQFPAWLEAAGATSRTVTHVVYTHLHGDHVGWGTTSSPGGWTPSFPGARHWIPRREYERSAELVRGGGDPIIDRSFDDSVVPLVEAGLVELADPGAVIAGVLEMVATPGHSAGHAGYRLESGGERAFFCGDVLHSPVQVLDPSLNTSYCALPEIARRTRREVLEAAAASGELVLPMHFGAPYCGRILRRGDGFAFRGEAWPDSDDGRSPVVEVAARPS